MAGNHDLIGHIVVDIPCPFDVGISDTETDAPPPKAAPSKAAPPPKAAPAIVADEADARSHALPKASGVADALAVRSLMFPRTSDDGETIYQTAPETYVGDLTPRLEHRALRNTHGQPVIVPDTNV